MLDKKGVRKRIAYYRKEHGMTPKDLAALLNISYQASSSSGKLLWYDNRVDKLEFVRIKMEPQNN